MPTTIRIRIRRGSSSEWTSANPVLQLGEIGADMTKHGLKVGDGYTSWNDLPFCSPEVVNDLVTGGDSKVLSAEQGKELKRQVDLKADKSTVTNMQTTLTTLINNNKVDLVHSITSTDATKALGAEQGKVLKDLIDGKADRSEVESIVASGGVNVENNLTSTSTVNALSANQGRVLKGMVDTVNTSITSLTNTVEGLSMFGMGYRISNFNGNGKPTKITFEDGVTATLTWDGQEVTRITASTGEVMEIIRDDYGRIIERKVTRS